MGKKPRRAGGKKAAPKAPGWPVALVAVLVLGLGGFAYFYGSSAQTGLSARHRVPGGEHRMVLNPALFTGAVARAYQVAREIPDVLDQIYCHCRCIENAGHLSNLSCFTDRHGAG